MPRTWKDTVVRPEQWERNMRFGTWNVMSLCRAGSLTAAARELARYKLDLVGLQEVRWDVTDPSFIISIIHYVDQ